LKRTPLASGQTPALSGLRNWFAVTSPRPCPMTPRSSRTEVFVGDEHGNGCRTNCERTEAQRVGVARAGRAGRAGRGATPTTRAAGRNNLLRRQPNRDAVISSLQ
jgi:hypothetical protein